MTATTGRSGRPSARRWRRQREAERAHGRAEEAHRTPSRQQRVQVRSAGGRLLHQHRLFGKSLRPARPSTWAALQRLPRPRVATAARASVDEKRTFGTRHAALAGCLGQRLQNAGNGATTAREAGRPCGLVVVVGDDREARVRAAQRPSRGTGTDAVPAPRRPARGRAVPRTSRRPRRSAGRCPAKCGWSCGNPARAPNASCHTGQPSRSTSRTQPGPGASGWSAPAPTTRAGVVASSSSRGHAADGLGVDVGRRAQQLGGRYGERILGRLRPVVRWVRPPTRGPAQVRAECDARASAPGTSCATGGRLGRDGVLTGQAVQPSR